MTAIPGTNVIAPIVPFSQEDEYPSHEAAYGRGGYRTVATTAARDAIPALRREAGMLVYVVATGKIWKLAADLSAWSELSSVSSWAELTGKPSVFPPAAHTHVPADVGLGAVDNTADADKPVSAAQAAADAAVASAAAADATSKAAAAQAAAVQRANHTGTQSASTITGLAAVALSNAYADLSGRPTLGTAASAASSDFAAASHTHPLSSLTQSSATTGQVPTWNGSAWAPATPSSGGSSLATYSSTASFPATGSASVLYLNTSTSRLYRWVSADSVYAEVGASGMADTLDGGAYA